MTISPKALIVEDDSTLTTICQRALTSSGYDTTIVSDGQTAIEQIDKIKPKLVVLDLHLPHISGEEVLKHIRFKAGLPETQVIIVSADAVLAQFLQAEADYVLTKPISYQQLRRLSKRLHSTYNN